MLVRLALMVLLSVLMAGSARCEPAADSTKALQGSAELLRGRMQECTAAEVGKLLKSGEGAAALADAALTICRHAVEDAVEGGVRLRRALMQRAMGQTEERDVRSSLRRTLRDAVLGEAAAARADGDRRREQATHATAQLAAQPVDGLKKAIAMCVEVFGAKLKDQFRDGDDAVESITGMCRPEIESLARVVFLADNAIGLQKARDEALAFAIQTAAKLFGGKGT